MDTEHWQAATHPQHGVQPGAEHIHAYLGAVLCAEKQQALAVGAHHSVAHTSIHAVKRHHLRGGAVCDRVDKAAPAQALEQET